MMHSNLDLQRKNFIQMIKSMRKVFEPQEVDLQMVEIYRDFIPEKIFDAHMHLCITETAPVICEAKRPTTVEDYMTDMMPYLPGVKEIRLNILPMPSHVLSNLENGLRDQANEHIFEQQRRHPECVVMPYVLPYDSEETIYALANQPGVKGFKCYYYGANAQISEKVAIGDFVPEIVWMIANEKKLVIELHIMRPEALSDSENFAYIMQKTKQYPNAQLVLAHCARAFAAWTCIDSVKRLDDQGNIWFDMSAVCESGPMMACILKNAGKRTMWGSDYPICMNRGRAISLGIGQEWLVGEQFEKLNRAYVATENLMAFWQASRLLELDKSQISDLFYNNAVRLFGKD